MLNTRASINKIVEGLALGLPLDFEDRDMPPGAGEYPSLAVRILGDDRRKAKYFGRRTPLSPLGAHQETLVLECEVRTKSTTWNQAMAYVVTIRASIDEKRFARRTWLLTAGTANPAPADAGWIQFGESRLNPLIAEGQPEYRSAFLTWECLVEVPVS